MIVTALDLLYPKNYCCGHYMIQPKCIETLLYTRHCARQYSFSKIWTKEKKIVKSSENHTWYLHKGSVKDHERNGCKLCQTEGRCEAHGRGHCCPCEWHRAEHHRQLVAVENNIKK